MDVEVTIGNYFPEVEVLMDIVIIYNDHLQHFKTTARMRLCFLKCADGDLL